METSSGLLLDCNSLTLCFWLFVTANIAVTARAGITCASCPSPVRVTRTDTQLDQRAVPGGTGSPPKRAEQERRLFDQSSGVFARQPAVAGGDGVDIVAAFEKASSGNGFNGIESSEVESTNEKHSTGKPTTPGSDMEKVVKSWDAAIFRAKRSWPEPFEFAESAWSSLGDQTHGESSERKNPGPLLDEQRRRTEPRWNRDDGKVRSTKQEEPKITSSTFALTGDSAHNHAVVYWSGQNSSVILILTKLYDFHLGSVTESTLWRSTDYGTTYEKLNDRVGTKTVLSYLYVCPMNKRKILVLTDPEFESSILISSDEGATYQKYRLSFYVLSLLFHPIQEDWALAYSHDQKLYSSVDFGRRWQLVHVAVTPNRFYWSVSGLDVEPDMVHLEANTADGRVQYVTCRAQSCSSEAHHQHPFSGYIERDSLVVQDDYMFIQVTSAGRAWYYVSYKREPFARIKLPKYSLPKDMHIISTDEGQVFAAVQEWNQNDTYNIYISDPQGIHFTLALENVRASRGLGGNSLIDLYEVEGIKGMLIANRKLENQVKTFITYNKGRDWRLLQAPNTDQEGNSIHCVLPFCSLHLQLQMSENPYLSGNIITKSSAPGVIVATGNIGPELSYNNVGMYISSDAGNSWRQIFEEEHNVWFLDKGGALMAVKQPTVPTRDLWVSFDEGRQWDRHSFSMVPLFVDGVLVEPGIDKQIMTFFGHFSHRSEWQLIKIDYKSLFSKRCTDGDYQTWHLHNQGEPCVMGQKQIYLKRRAASNCMLGPGYNRVLSSEPCTCRAHDFECDYGYERRGDGNCSPSFWFNPSIVSRSCSQGQNYLNTTGYRRVAANNCTKGVNDMYMARRQTCPNRPPRGLQLRTSEGKLTAALHSNVTFLVQLEEGDSMRTHIQLDFGDGTAVSYSNLTWAEEGIKHVYRSAGIFLVTVLAENEMGADSTSLHLHVTCEVEHVQLLAPFVVIQNKEVNLTAVVWPSRSRTLTYFWWLGNSSEPIITLDGSISHTFTRGGMNTVAVQVSSANSILQDTKTIVVQEFFKSLLLSFSPNLDEVNPDIPEWRQDVGRVIKKALLQVVDIPESHLLVAVFPGIPTAAELFLLPSKNQSAGRRKKEEELEEISEVLVSALNQNLVEFELRPAFRIIVYITQLTSAPLVDSLPRHSSSAMLMLLSVVFLGLAVFLIYKFKRKIPWINMDAEVNHEKEQEMINTVNDTAPPKVTLSDLPTQKEMMEKELECRIKRSMVNSCESTREIPNCTSV